jgi:hypothetical protein
MNSVYFFAIMIVECMNGYIKDKVQVGGVDIDQPVYSKEG